MDTIFPIDMSNDQRLNAKKTCLCPYNALLIRSYSQPSPPAAEASASGFQGRGPPGKKWELYGNSNGF